MSRTVEVVPPPSTREKLAPLTEIHWNPIDNSGEVKFWMQELVTVGGEVTGLEPCHDGDQVIRISLADLLPRTIVVATPNGPVEVPAMLLMGAVKTLFDELFAERAARQG